MRGLLGLIAVLAGVVPAMAVPQSLPLTPLRERLRNIEVVTNGVPATFMLDTGSGITTISPAFAKKIGCHPWGRITGFRMFGDRLDMQRCDGVRLRIGAVSFAPATLAVVDSTPYLKPGEVAPDGAIGLDLFANRIITLDVAGNHLILEDEGSLAPRLAGATEIPLRVSREVWATDAYAGVDGPQGRLWFLLDSGAGGVLLVAKDHASGFGLNPAAEGPQPLNFTLAPGIPVSGQAVTPDLIMDGNLGMPFLRHYTVTLDLPNQRMWVKANPPKP